ncbi:MAG: LPS export ABC transporter permease LptG [Candidatus Methylomirabilales bacterium]
MRLLDRYIARECLKILALCLVVFIGIYLVVDLFDKLSGFLEARADAGMILRYYGFRLPKILTEVLPVAVLLACLLSLGGMAKDNEVLAMKMGHVSSLRIALPCIGVGLAASLAAWTIVEYIAPRANERALNIERTEIKKLPAHRVTHDSDIWYRAEGDRFVHISLFEPQSGLIRGMSIFQLSPDFDLIRRVDAQVASRSEGGWTVRDGYQVELDKNSIRITPFKEMGVPLAERPEDFARVAPSPEEMSYGELRQYIDKLAKSGLSTTRYLVDLHAKVATALISLIMALLGVSFGLRTGRAGVMIWVGTCIPMGFVYYVLLFLGISFGRGGAIPPLLAPWLPNLTFGAASLISLWRLRG